MSFAITKDGNLTVFFDNERRQVGRTISEGDVVAHMTIPVTDGELQQLRDLLNELYPLEQPETEPDDYSDIRPGDIVEFDLKNRHYGPTSCDIDDAGDSYILARTGGRMWFLRFDGTPFSKVRNIVIHRELRTGEPESQGLYITQSGKILVKDGSDERTNWNYIDEDDDKMWTCSWNVLIKKFDESEFPLRKAKAVAE